MTKKPKGEKKKKSIVRRILKWTGITFLVLLIAIIVLPYVFREQIKNLVIKEANKQLTADFNLKDYDITFLSTFPKFTLELDSVTLTGRDEFKGIQLVNMKSLEASLNIWSVIKGDKIEIKTIKLVEPNIHVIVTKEGKANYDIVKTDSTAKEEPAEESNFALKLKSYEIVGGNIIYDDKAGDMFANIVNLNHSGSGDLTAEKVDFKTTTTADAISFVMSGVPYLAAVKTDATINLLMEFKENSSKFTLKDNAIALNAFKFSFNGWYEMFDKYSDMDITLDTKKSGFKELISLIPKIFQSGYESMVTKGSLALDGRVNGKMTDTELPAWNFNLEVSNASFKYPDLPASVSNINIKANTSRAQGANLDNIKVDVDKFHAEFVQNTIDATLKLRNPMSDPYIATKILVKVDLATLGKVIPLSKGESYNGKLDADIKLDGKMSDIDKENYEAFNAEGWLSLKEMKYVSADLKAPVEIQNMMFRFTPQNLALEEMTAKIGASDFQIDGKVDNYLGYMLRDEKLVGKFNYHSNYLNLDELMGISPTSETPAAETAPAPQAASEEAYAIPENIDFNLNASVDKINYDGVEINNLKGNVNLNNGIASLNNLKMNTLGGTVGLDGKYNTLNPAKPKIDLAYDLMDIDINKLATNFLTVDKLAPFAKFAQGRISTKLTMNGELTPDLSPILESLSGKGDFSTNSIKIDGFEPLTKLANELKMPQLSSLDIQNVKTKFEFKEGTVTVQPFNVKLGKISTDIHGTTSFNTDINYDMKMNIPKDQVPAAMIKLVEDAIGKVNSLAPGLNLKGLPDIIPVKVGVGGTVMKPIIKSNFKESIMELTGNAKDQIKDLVNKAKDSVTTIIKDKIEDVKEDFTARKNKIMADAQVQADKVTAEAKKQADALRAEGNKQAQALLDGAANPIEKKLKQKAADELKKKAEQSAQKVEQEAKTQSDNIMNQARAKADALGN